ncbi:hypothetical protein EDD21DRAFT_387914 [Dissophora ornata]|nr:hypothetical protein EDD21DRAFT_387914 [Dissophora ornata]
MFLFARRRRRQEGIPPVGAPVEDYSEYDVDREEIPPMVPLGPIDLESKPSYPTPGSESSAPAGPSGSGHGFPIVPAPVPVGHNSHAEEIIGGTAAVTAIGVVASRRDQREEVSNNHVVPVPVPSKSPDTEAESSSGRDLPAVIPIPGGPSNENSTKPSGPGFFPIGSTTTETTETTETETGPHFGRDVLLGAAAGAAGMALLGKKRSNETTVTSKTIVTTTKNGGRIYTTTGTGGRTVVTDRTENGPRHVLTGVIPGTTTVRTITQRTESGEDILIPVDAPEGEERTVIAERDERGNIRYIIGGLIAGAVGTSVIRNVVSSSTESETSRIVPGGTTSTTTSIRIITERAPNGETRYVIVGNFSGNAIRVLTERTASGEILLVPTNEATGELYHVITERTESGGSRNIIGGIIAGGVVRNVTESGSTRVITGGVISITSETRIVTERTSTGEIRYILIGGFGGNAIRVFTEKNSSGEIRLIPTNDASGELRHVITERTESGETRYIIGGIINTNTITRVIMGPRIVTERTSSGEIRYVIIDQYNGNAIRTKFERSEETGEFVHIPVKEPEGELRYVTKETTETGETRTVIGGVITGNVTTTSRIVSGGLVPEGAPTSIQTRIVAERSENGETRYYQITNGSDGQEIRTVVERTEDGGFRIPGGAVIVAAGAALVGNNHQSTTTTRVVGGGTLTPAEQAANRTQITLKLSIMRYERADASAAVPSAAIGTVMFSKFKMLERGDVNIEDTEYSHVEEVKTPNARRTVKWMKTEAHWKREAGMLQHLKSDSFIADLYTLYSLPTFAEYRYVSILGSYSRTLESYMQTEQLSSIQIRQLTASLSEALRWCHEHHVVHLNVRPASFYLEGVPSRDSNGQSVWKLWNFGHARFVGETVDTSVTTATYAAPEILNGRKKGENVLSAVSMDRWSLGLIIYELHARKAYFSSSNFAEFQLTSDEGTKFDPNLESVREDDARQAIRGLLEVDAERRYTHETLRAVYINQA